MSSWKGKQQWLTAMRKTTPALYARVQGEYIARGTEMVSLAQVLCPVQADAPFHQPPGTARDSIHLEIDADSSGRIAIKVVAGAGVAFYARFIEFGTRAGVKGSSYFSVSRQRMRKVYRTHPGTPPHPFFWPAYHQTLGKLRGDLTGIASAAMAEAVG